MAEKKDIKGLNDTQKSFIYNLVREIKEGLRFDKRRAYDKDNCKEALFLLAIALLGDMAGYSLPKKNMYKTLFEKLENLECRYEGILPLVALLYKKSKDLGVDHSVTKAAREFLNGKVPGARKMRPVTDSAAKWIDTSLEEMGRLGRNPLLNSSTYSRIFRYMEKIR